MGPFAYKELSYPWALACNYKRSFICKRSLIHKGSFAYKELSMWPSSSWTSNELPVTTISRNNPSHANPMHAPRMQTPCMPFNTKP